MTDKELYEYIKSRTYYCKTCGDLKQKVMENGVEEIEKYDGWVCSGVEDMKMRYYGIDTSPIDIDELMED